MTDEERKAWEEMVAIRKSFYKTYGYYDVSDEDPVILAADAELAALRAERDRLRAALRCTSENCSEFGHIHDGYCSACPQGIIRRRAYGEGE